MLTHHITLAFRRILNNKNYTLLNIFGLSVGLACFTMIALWVKSELSFDRFHAKANRIYRVASTFTDESISISEAVTGPPLAPALMKDFPEVENAVRIDPTDATILIDDKMFVEDDMLLTDQSFFQFFNFPLLSGDATTALTEPYTIVVSKSMAKRYFGDVDPIGKLIRIFRYDPDGNGMDFKITGVIGDCPANSQFHYNALISFKTWETARPEILELGGWYNNVVYTYVLLHEQADQAMFQSKLSSFIKRYLGNDTSEGKSLRQYFLQPFTDIYLRSKLHYEIGPTGSMTYVFIFGSIGVIVLLLACINYINLATAYSSDRFKEVGVHKVMGARKGQLVTKYLAESWLLAMVSLLISFAWIELSRPFFESIAARPLPGLYSLRFIALLLLAGSLIGLAAGLYPSLVLSSFLPINALKGRTGSFSGAWLRKALIVIQYSATAVLIIGILVVHLQMKYIHEKDLGFNKDQLVVFGVHGSGEVVSGYDVFANELKTSQNVGGIARSNTTIGGGLGNSMAITEDAAGKKLSTTIYRLRVDYDYLSVYEIDLIAGRNFIPANAADSTRAFIVNETATKTFGYKNPADAIGKPFELDESKGQIIGVVKDFNFNGLRHKVEPLCLWLLQGGYSRISIRINGDTQKGFDEVSMLWKKHFANSVFQYSFYEDSLQSQYQSDERFAKTILVFSLVSLAIACLGLFALVSYNVEKRTKEIGIRKVLGASVLNILAMLSTEFLWLIITSLLIALPLGYYLMNQWLTGFAYHISLHVLLFVAAGGIVLSIAWLTISIRSFRAASTNPVKALRSE